MPQPRGHKYYSDLSNTVNQHIKNCFPGSIIEKSGSRARDDFERDSDLDMIICIPGNPSRVNFYPELVLCLENKIKYFRNERIRVRKGINGNVVNILPQDGGKISYALIPCS